MAARRPAPAPPRPDGLTWHPSLACGPCLEVWFPGWTPDLDVDSQHQSRPIAARRRWATARRYWLEATRPVWELAPDARPKWAAWGAAPWSYLWLAGRDPESLAVCLARWDLPADWTPTPAPRALLVDLDPYTAPSPEVVRLLLGEPPRRLETP